LRHVIVDTLNGASGGPPAHHKAKQFLSPFLFRVSFALKALWERPMPQPTDTASSPRHPDAPHRVVTRRPVHYARPTQQWLDFLAGLLAQTAQAERASADRTESPARP